VPVVTGLRETRSGRVVVDLDGARWRVLPLDAVARARLAVGEDLDRPRLRDLAREVRRARALETGLRAVARRDQSAAALHARLERRRIGSRERQEAVGRLVSAGLVDDRRYAFQRAASLAARGHGDAAIRWRLEREGVDAAIAAEALGTIESETERARRLVEVRGLGPRTARELARRGFSEEAVERAVSGLVADET
jgi:SOS response regulatory protein OraA/RecX